MKTKLILLLITGFLLFNNNASAQDPNFFVFLSFGQSNMEGPAIIEEQDKIVDERFRLLSSVDCPNLNRVMGTWYSAVPPLCRCNTKLSPADYFGRTMVENLPSNVRVGIINVSVAGSKIELFDKASYQTYMTTVAPWMLNIIKEYGGSPYDRLVEMAKIAQKQGVIKGILLHQGESNTGDTAWAAKTKKVYDDLLRDLNLPPNSLPLLAGETVNADQQGRTASMNQIIATLPQTIPTAVVVPSDGCTAAGDHLHFNSAGIRKFGKRYAAKMLTALGYKAPVVE
jgi:para-nitrobenzyl esterase